MNRNLLNQHIPQLLYRYTQQAVIVSAMAVAAMLCIVIFRPFNIYESLDFLVSGALSGWIDSTEDAFYLASAIVVIIGVVLVSISRLVMVRSRHLALTYKGYIAWCLVEFAIVALVITTCSASWFHPDNTGFVHLFANVLGRTSCILFVPYAFCLLYIIIIDKTQQINKLNENIRNEENNLQRAYVLFYDDHNEMRLSVKREDLVMIESADNYICVWYINNDSVKKVMVRNTMKRIAEQLADTSVQRCHRSYMVNMDRVKVLRRDKDGVFIEFGIEGIFDVPISRTYITTITNWLMK